MNASAVDGSPCALDVTCPLSSWLKLKKKGSNVEKLGTARANYYITHCLALGFPGRSIKDQDKPPSPVPLTYFCLQHDNRINTLKVPHRPMKTRQTTLI